MKSANRVARNTGFLYGKMLITMFISLYSTRLILSALGEVDYGIFNLVAGVIAMLSFLNSAMSIATVRYLSYYLGAGDLEKLKKLFNTSVVLHLIIGLIIVVLLEIAGIFLFDGVLNIPEDRVTTAKWVYHFMVISTFFTINAVPYHAAINAHENMLFDALTGIFESFAKLGIAIWIIYTRIDNLILYGVLIASLTILVRIVMSFYCVRKYPECRTNFRAHLEIPMLKEMFSFAGWNLFGSLCAVIRSQGLAVIMNFFFGVVVNAAYGIANQVNGQLSAFSTNMLRSLNPQIVKSEGGGDRDRMLRLAMLASKISFFLLAFFAIPLIVEMPFVLDIWLKEVPENTIMFCRIILVLSLLQQLSTGLMVSVNAGGNIKLYQVTVGSLLILNLPLSIGLIKLGLPVYSILIGSVFLELVAFAFRIWFAKRLVGLPVPVFLRTVVLAALLSVILSTSAALLPLLFMKAGFARAIVAGLLSTATLMVAGRYIGLTKQEVTQVKDLLISFVKKLNVVHGKILSKFNAD